MYDKVKLFIPRTSTTPDISSCLDKAKEQVDLNTGEICVFGSLEGFKVNIFTGGYTITGSLSKFLYPSNVYPLDRHSTARAIEKLSDSIHLDVSTAMVTGIEFGTQFVMKKKAAEYLTKLGDMPRLQRYHFDIGTLYYKPRGKQQNKVFCFYDKGADAKAKGLVLPNSLSCANLLKYEMRLNGRLPQQLGVGDVVASTLYNREFYKKLVQMWQQYYFSITKMHSIKTNVMTEINSVNDAFEVFVARLISQGDTTQIADYVEELKAGKVFEDRKAYSRLKSKLLKVASKASFSVCDEDIKELDDEVKNAGAYV